MESHIDSLAAASDDSAPFDIGTVFHEQYPRIVRLIARIVNDHARAEDIAVEVFWKLWRTPRAQAGNANGWLYRTAIRKSLDGLRRQARREKYERLVRWASAPPTPEQEHSIEQRQRQVRTVLSVMKARDAELLLLRSEGLRYQETAQILGLNPASVGTLLGRAQQTFRKEYIKRYGKEN